MPDSPGSGPRRNSRANWVALRTLRQLPKVVGETRTGEPIFEVQSVRLLLPRDAGHFIRLAECAKCGGEVPGAAVLTATDLEHSPNPVICKSCVRSATAPVFSAERRPALAAPKARNAARNGNGNLDAPAANGVGPLHSGVPSDVRAAIDGALSDTRDQLDALGGVVEGLVRSQQERGRAQMTVATPARDAATPSDLEDRLERLQASIDEEVLRAREDVLEVAQDTDAVRLVQDDVRGRLGNLVDRVEAMQEELTELARVHDRRDELFDHVLARLSHVDEVAAQLRAEGEAQRIDLRAAFEARMAGFQTRVGADVDRLADGLRELEDRFGSELVRAVVAASAHEHPEHDRLEAQINDRLDRHAERAERRAESERVRVAAVDRRLAELSGLLGAATESIRTELHEWLRDSVAEIRAAMSAVDARSSGRLQALESQVERSSAEVSRLVELQPALDEGLGQLRSEISEVRDQGRRPPAAVGEGSGRGLAVPEPVRPVFVETDTGRGRGGKSAAKAQLAAVSTATDDLVRECRRLAARITWLEDSVQAATDAAAHAARQAAAIAPLRRTIKTLQSELDAKDAVLAELTETVEKLRRPRAKPAAWATEKATLPKQPAPRKSARRTPS